MVLQIHLKTSMTGNGRWVTVTDVDFARSLATLFCRPKDIWAALNFSIGEAAKASRFSYTTQRLLYTSTKFRNPERL